jgi:hypothetical protein
MSVVGIASKGQIIREIMDNSKYINMYIKNSKSQNSTSNVHTYFDLKNLESPK